MTPRRRWAAALASTALAATALVTAAAPAAAHPRGGPEPFTPTFTPSPCAVPLPDGVVDGEDIRCGSVTVPARHDRPDGPTIDLAVAIRAPLVPDAEPDPLLVLGGGPGDDVIALVPVLTDPSLAAAADFAPDREVVLLNQRGTPYTRPELRCPDVPATVARVDLPSREVNRLTVRETRECRRELRAQGVDLGAYTTVDNARDLGLAADALGYEQVNVFGTSYGTRLTLEAARQGDPSWMRTMVLSSPVPTQTNLMAAASRAYQEALDELYSSCAADPECAALGDLRAALEGGVARLAREPSRVPVTDPETGATTVVVLDAPRVSELVFLLLYTPSGIRALPGLIAALGAGDDVPMATAALQNADPTSTQGEGMQRAVWCADFVRPASPRDLRAAAADVSPVAGTYFQAGPAGGTLWGPLAFPTCRGWTDPRAERASPEPVVSDIPTLVVTGQFDPITPPSFGEETVRTLSTSYLVEAPGLGHSPLLNGMPQCWPTLLQQFLDDPLTAPDASCVTRPPAG